MTSATTALTLVLVLLASGCNQSQSPATDVDAGLPDGGIRRGSNKVDRVIARAAAQAVAPSGSAANAPPADGVLEPARADAELAVGAVPVLTVASTGAEPKQPVPAVSLKDNTTATLELGMEMGQGQMLPPLVLSLSLKTRPVPKGERLQPVEAKITRVDLGTTPLPEEFRRQVKKLQNCKIRFGLSEDGAPQGVVTERSSTDAEMIQDLLDAAAEGLQLSLVPMPRVPIGSGATWLVKSREKFLGIDTISYRMVKAVGATPSGIELEFDVRRYVVGREPPAQMREQGQSLRIGEANSTARGKATTNTQLGFTQRSESSQALRLVLVGEDANAGQRVLQVGARYGFRLGS